MLANKNKFNLWPFVFVLTFGGCATLPKNFQSSVSTSIGQEETTPLGNMLKPRLSAHAGQSGFFVLNTGEEAFRARIALADTAERTIDCQYFIWNGDKSGIILIDRLIRAADRGVRVRILIDDITSHGKDLGLAALNEHPHIQIRIFNPLGRRYYLGIFRNLAMAFHVGRMTNRMHNKIFAVDNQAVIVGGRNIADEYFGVSEHFNFRDMDLLAVGPIVGRVSSAFDGYWNSPWSIPFEVFKTHQPSHEKYEKKLKGLRVQFNKAERTFPYKLDWDRNNLLATLAEKCEKLSWGEAEAICDPPDKAWQRAERGKSKSEIVKRLEDLISESTSSILAVSPYLILSSKNVEKMGTVVKRGVSFKVFTNSLRSNDAVPAVAMYRKIRKPLLQQGVELHEMKADADIKKKYAPSGLEKSRIGLHAKAVIFDRKSVFVGTFNIDPRSEHLNTEVGLLVHSPPLAEEVSQRFEEDLKPENSYLVQMNKKGKNLEWVCEEKGKEKTYSSDPLAGPWLRFEAGFLGLLPISHQL